MSFLFSVEIFSEVCYSKWLGPANGPHETVQLVFAYSVFFLGNLCDMHPRLPAYFFILMILDSCRLGVLYEANDNSPSSEIKAGLVPSSRIASGIRECLFRTCAICCGVRPSSVYE